MKISVFGVKCSALTTELVADSIKISIGDKEFVIVDRNISSIEIRKNNSKKDSDRISIKPISSNVIEVG